MNSLSKLSPPPAANGRAEAAGPRPAPAVRLNDMVQVLRRHRVLFVGSVAVVMMASALALFLVTPKYTAQTTVMIYPREEKVIDIDAVVSRLTADDQAIESEIRILQSSELAGRVADQLNLQQREEFNPAIGSSLVDVVLERVDWPWLRVAFGSIRQPDPVAAAADVETKVVERVLDRLAVEALGRSRVISISFTSEDPRLAAGVANALAGAYIDFQVETKLAATQQAADWLRGRLQSLGDEVVASDQAVENYRADIIEREGRDAKLLEQQVTETSTQLTLARAEHENARARLAQIEQTVNEHGLVAVLEVVDPQWTLQLDQHLVWLRQTDAELTARFGETHPVVRDLRGQIQDIRDETARRLIAAARNDVSASSAKVEALQTELDRLLQDSIAIARAHVKLRALEREASANEELFQAFLSRSKETAQVGFERPDALVVSRATPPAEPSSPNRLQFMLVALAGSLVVGCGFVFVAEELAVGYRNVEELADELATRPLGQVPFIAKRTWRERPAELVLAEPAGPFPEALRLLHSQLMLLSRAGERQAIGQIVQFTSTVPKEGKSTIVAALARVAASSHLRVVAVDADLRRPTLHLAFGLERTAGLAEHLAGELPADRILRKDPRSSADLVVAGSATGDVLRLLRSSRLGELFATLRRRYDLVLVDSPPLLPVADAHAIGPLVDHRILVVRAGVTSRETVRSANRRLEENGLRLSGALLTQVKRGSDSGSAYGYYGYQA